jgi:hypothetical protein
MVSEKHKAFIRNVVNGMHQKEAYRVSVGKKGVSSRTCEVKSSELVRKYANEIAEGQRLNREIAEKANEKNLEKIIERKIMSAARRMEILTQIAEGELEKKETFMLNGAPVEKISTPDFSDRRNAISELNKMDGSYAANKTDITVKDAVSFYLPKEDGDNSKG